MRRMSFSLTQAQIIGQRKTVTRRQGWASLQPGDFIQPIEKGMGLKKGEKQKLLGCPIEILEVTWTPIEDIDIADVVLEGFMDMSVEEFIHFYCKANKAKPSDYCRRISFMYTEELSDNEAVRQELEYGRLLQAN